LGEHLKIERVPKYFNYFISISLKMLVLNVEGKIMNLEGEFERISNGKLDLYKNWSFAYSWTIPIGRDIRRYHSYMSPFSKIGEGRSTQY